MKALAPVLAAVCLAAVAAGCGQEDAPDLVNGKALFVERCGSCHVIARANTAGTQGPDLDAAFRTALRDGFDRETVEGVVKNQISNVLSGSVMPADLVTGADADDVAAYVAFAVAKRGEDEGALAQAGLPSGGGPEVGKQLFTAAGCGSCHALADAGTDGDAGPALDDLASIAAGAGGKPEDYVEQAIVEPAAVIADGFADGVMPSTYGEQFTPEQVMALVEYLLSVSN